jgi:5-methylcytosine-specific restriction protein A
VTFVRTSNAAPFVFKGLFRYQDILREEDGSKAFVLSLSALDEFEVVSGSDYVANNLEKSIAQSLASPRQQRLERLAKAQRKPSVFKVMSTAFSRNADVIAEALYLAAGVCQHCGQPAPFTRRADKSPYLEVHHRLPLAMGGEDTVENAIALCPNCHRESHYG